ncbi:hypothetical protein ABIC37_005111 [Priestia megaterium]|uniref:hypothetical protein n=1 Tax=Priestia megaterium TaxID=1404 RepID=UPI00339A2E39
MSNTDIKFFSDNRFRAVFRYCIRDNKYIGGFPDFIDRSSAVSEKNYDVDKVFNYIGVFRIHQGAGKVKEIPLDVFNRDWSGNLSLPTYRIRRANALIKELGYGNEFKAAFPTFEMGPNGGVEVLFLYEKAAKFKEISKDELNGIGFPTVMNSEVLLMRAVNAYNCIGYKGEYAGGFPTYLGEYNPIYAFMLTKGFCSYEEIPDIHDFVQMFDIQGFSGNFSEHIKSALCEVVRKLDRSQHLKPVEKHKLVDEVFKKKAVRFRPGSGPWNGFTPVIGGEEIQINQAQFSTITSTSSPDFLNLCQTVIHELMHVAGYDHITYNPSFNAYAGAGCTGSSTGVPADAWNYFDSAPLRAECCINGNQNLMINK